MTQSRFAFAYRRAVWPNKVGHCRDFLALLRASLDAMAAKTARPGAMPEGRFAGAGGGRAERAGDRGQGQALCRCGRVRPGIRARHEGVPAKGRSGRLRRFGAILADPGHAGAEKAPHTNTEAAAKRPPGGKLTDQAIARNRRISSRRFAVERGNALIKNHGIVNKMHGTTLKSSTARSGRFAGRSTSEPCAEKSIPQTVAAPASRGARPCRIQGACGPKCARRHAGPFTTQGTASAS